MIGLFLRTVILVRYVAYYFMRDLYLVSQRFCLLVLLMLAMQTIMLILLSFRMSFTVLVFCFAAFEKRFFLL